MSSRDLGLDGDVDAVSAVGRIERGLQDSAIAIMMRCRMPPLN
jgi:hypothetical protein